MPALVATSTVLAATAVAGVAASAYSGYKQGKAADKAAKLASQPRTSETTRLPYMNEQLQPMMPYIMKEALDIYKYRRGANPGGPAGNFDAIDKMLSDIIAKQSSGEGGPSAGWHNSPRSWQPPGENPNPAGQLSGGSWRSEQLPDLRSGKVLR